MLKLMSMEIKDGKCIRQLKIYHKTMIKIITENSKFTVIPRT